MRVIGGKFRSRPLHSLRGMDLRPTADRLRETLFNVLGAGNAAAFEGKVWFDLCAGTGAVGIEARKTRSEDLVAVFCGWMRDPGYTGKQLSDTPLYRGERALGFGT